MRSIWIVLLAAALCGGNAYAQKGDAPANVKAAFAKKYAGATQVKWDKEGKGYEASFTYNGKEMSVEYNADGSVAATETIIAEHELPAVAQKYASAKGKIKEAARIELTNGTVQYEAEVNGKDLLFDQAGNPLKKKEEKEEDKH